MDHTLRFHGCGDKNDGPIPFSQLEQYFVFNDWANTGCLFFGKLFEANFDPLAPFGASVGAFFGDNQEDTRRQTGRLARRQTGNQTGRQEDRQEDKQEDKQEDRHRQEHRQEDKQEDCDGLA